MTGFVSIVYMTRAVLMLVAAVDIIEVLLSKATVFSRVVNIQ